MKLNPHMNKHIILTILIILIFIISACTTTAEVPTTEPQQATMLTISGSGGTTPIMAAIADSFAADYPTYQIETLSGSGTGGGVQGIIEGVLDVAAMGRPPKPEEAEQIEFFSLGHGAEVPFVHADVSVSELNSKQLQAIFAGEITNWEELGGNDIPIVVFTRAEDTPHTDILRQTFLGDAVFTESARVMGGMGDILVAVEGTPGAIGYVNWPTAAALEANVTPITIDEFAPNNPEYPATLEIGIGYLPEREADVTPLIDWLSSEAGQAKLLEFGVLAMK